MPLHSSPTCVFHTRPGLSLSESFWCQSLCWHYLASLARLSLKIMHSALLLAALPLSLSRRRSLDGGWKPVKSLCCVSLSAQG